MGHYMIHLPLHWWKCSLVGDGKNRAKGESNFFHTCSSFVVLTRIGQPFNFPFPQMILTTKQKCQSGVNSLFILSLLVMCLALSESRLNTSDPKCDFHIDFLLQAITVIFSNTQRWINPSRVLCRLSSPHFQRWKLFPASHYNHQTVHLALNICIYLRSFRSVSMVRIYSNAFQKRPISVWFNVPSFHSHLQML